MRIAVMYGGSSTERDVSLVTGRAVALALVDRGHDVVLVDPARGDSPVGPREAEAAAAIGREPPAAFEEGGTAIAAISGEAVRRADVVFVALHGGSGEDGTVQGLLEMAGKRYTGSGVLASALAMDKRAAKLLFREARVPTPEGRVISLDRGLPVEERGGAPAFEGDLPVSEAASAIAALGGLPVVVKPNDQGSTVGLTVVDSEGALAPAIAEAARHSRLVLVEQYIPGREVTAAILGGRALPVVEIVPRRGLYDYESKYTSGMSEYHCPAALTDPLTREISRVGEEAFACLGCRGYARVDFRLAPDGRFFCLEVNTTPGMTGVSLVPMAAAVAGLSFGELCEKIVDLALI